MQAIMDYQWKKETLEYIEECGFKEFTTIQQQAMPYILKGQDVIGLSDTGTGKTHAFLLPILEKVDFDSNYTQAVIIAPTRELARQIYQMAKPYCSINKKARIALISSEISKERMIQNLSKNPQIVIGTPGRIRDAFIKEGVLRAETTDILVIDEADMTVEFGFINDVDAIAGHMKDKLQILAFSATMPQVLKNFLEKYMHQPKNIKIKNDKDYFSNVKHYLIPSKQKSYLDALKRILPGINPYICLIFVNSREEADEVNSLLVQLKLNPVELHGGMTQRQRKNAMKLIQSLDAQYIVATDIAARGIDIPGVSHVVSLGFPKAIDYYIHRSGRTGRNKKDGICYAIYRYEDDEAIQYLIKQGIKFEHKNYKNNQWITLKPYGYKRQKPVTQLEKDIRKIASKKVKQVKPGYKKKRAAEIDKLKRKHRREMIQQSIKNLSKQKNKLKQREKNQ